jgi:hypothetical protein
MPWANQLWPNQAWANQQRITQHFNAAAARNFPAAALAGDLWYATDTQQLFVAVVNPNQYFPGITDGQNVTRVWSEGLVVTATTRANVPTSAAVGKVFLTTDTLEAFAGTGLSVVPFRLDVSRALRGGPAASKVGLTSLVPIPVFFVALDD